MTAIYTRCGGGCASLGDFYSDNCFVWFFRCSKVHVSG
jgi:hypothetical protein